MNVATMRIAIADSYPRRTWKEKVKHMPDDQVIAIYKSMEQNGRLYNHTKPKPPSDNLAPKAGFVRQLSFDDILPER